jgi:hypothetical protein
VIESNELTWRKTAHGFVLHRQNRGRALLAVVPDDTYLGMWRVRLPDGRLSNLTNISRAKDAAVSIALAILNHHQKSNRDIRSEASPARRNRSPLPWAPSDRSKSPAALPANVVREGAP